MSSSLIAVREVWAERSQARTRGDLLYLLYVVVLSVLIFVTPALQIAGTFLARPDVVPALLIDRAPQLTAAATLAAGAGGVLIGAVRGPALLAPFFTATLAFSGIRRRDVLWRPFARSLLAPVLGMATVAALVAATLVTAGHVSATGAAWFVLAAVGAGLLIGAAWLAGELLEAGPRRLLAAALLVMAAVAAALPSGIGLGGAYPVGATAPSAWAAALLSMGLLATAAGMILLDGLRGTVLREQAARWESATTVATTGDVAGAAGVFRVPPSTGRGLRAIGSGPLLLLYARRDGVAWLRSPERLVTGAGAGLLAAATLAGSTLLSGPLAWGAVLLGAGALWGASGALVDGIRHAVHTLGAPVLFGQSAPRQAVLHTAAPILLMAVLAVSGGGTVLVAAGAGSSALGAALLPLGLVPVLIVGRVRDAAKGPMPLALSTPMPTAQGDLAVLLMLAWQSDGILLALLSGVVLAALSMLGPPWMLGGAVLLTAAMALMAWARLRALRR